MHSIEFENDEDKRWSDLQTTTFIFQLTCSIKYLNQQNNISIDFKSI